MSTQFLEEKIDWPAFIQTHNLKWDRMPLRWETAPFLGNGLVGTMIYGSQDSTHVKFWVCRSDIGRLDYPGHFEDPMRKVIGTFNLQTNGKILSDQCHAVLNIWNGEASGYIKTTQGGIAWTCFVPEDEVGIVVELKPDIGESNTKWTTDFKENGLFSKRDGFSVFKVGDSVHHERTEVASGGYTIAWKQKPEHQRQIFLFTIGASRINRNQWEVSPTAYSAYEEAIRSLDRLDNKSLEQLKASHQKWWHSFYPRSFFSLSDPELESYYWIQLYKMAATTRKDKPMIDNHGVWTVHPVYGFATWDLNVQAIYRLYLKSNHLEFGEPLLRFMDRNFNETTMWDNTSQEFRAGMKQQTFLRYRFFDKEFWEHAPDLPADGPAKFLWGCHNYWLHYRYAMDTTLLRPLLLKLEGGINAISATLKKGENGLLHIPSGRNWENWTGEDPTGIYTVFNWALVTAAEIGKKIDYDRNKIDRWESLKKNLAGYPTGKYPNGKTGFLLGKNQVPLPHRHWTHLMMMFPLQLITWEQEDKRELIENSVDYWAGISAGLDGHNPRAGYSPVAAICLYAYMNKTEKIPGLIDIYLHRNARRGPNVWPSTMYREYGPVIETPLFFANSLQELVLQSRAGIIHIFPAVSEAMDDISFHNFRAHGGFFVSAQRTNGHTDFIQVKSPEGGECILNTDLKDYEVLNGDSHKVKPLGGNVYEIILAKGETIVMRSANYSGKLLIRPVNPQIGREAMYGLNQNFLNRHPNIKRYLESPYSPDLWREKELSD